MPRTAVIFSPEYYKHNPGKDHPESAKRLNAIVKELKQGQLSRSRNWRFIKPDKAGIEEVRSVHKKKYIDYVRALCKSGGGLLDSGDTVVSPESYETALLAAGGALKAASLVIQRDYENSFALVRPPGHHASEISGRGFCVFNNVAIAAKHLLRNCGLERILILDIDSHHGNGTQQIFFQTDRVLYVSLHEDPRGFPGTGFIKEVGEGLGHGYTVNIPLPLRTGDQIYLKAWKEIVIPISLQYKPQFVLVSAGLDCHYADPVGQLSLSAFCYDEIFLSITSLASHLCRGRLALILEGGYGARFVGRIASAAIARLSQAKYQLDDQVPMVPQRLTDKGEKVIKEVKEVQQDYWNLD
jgi:acetoin utilization deacetylase AcuC-like enzyme